jgi:type IV pilus assembly protein PilX
MPIKIYKCLQRQQGVILVVALIMLLAMTIVGVTLITGSTLQERLAGSSRQLSVARANAEGALREAEETLRAISTAGVLTLPAIETNFLGQTGHYVELSNPGFLTAFSKLSEDVSDPDNWGGSPPAITAEVASTVTSPAGGNITEPRYVIEYLGTLELGASDSPNVGAGTTITTNPFVFRITAIGYGVNDRISSILESIYTSQVNN